MWRGSGGEIIESYAILTTRPNELMEPIHNRMPVILGEDEEGAWLDVEGTEITALLKSLETPFPSEHLEAFPVSTRVNSPRFDQPDLIERV